MVSSETSSVSFVNFRPITICRRFRGVEASQSGHPSAASTSLSVLTHSMVQSLRRVDVDIRLDWKDSPGRRQGQRQRQRRVSVRIGIGVGVGVRIGVIGISVSVSVGVRISIGVASASASIGISISIGVCIGVCIGIGNISSQAHISSAIRVFTSVLVFLE